jgi:hypothetical protein
MPTTEFDHILAVLHLLQNKHSIANLTIRLVERTQRRYMIQATLGHGSIPVLKPVVFSMLEPKHLGCPRSQL